MSRDDQTPSTNNPLDDFNDCHMGIIQGLAALEELPVLVEAANRARRVSIPRQSRGL